MNHFARTPFFFAAFFIAFFAGDRFDAPRFISRRRYF
jgi:hypothetical protein